MSAQVGVNEFELEPSLSKLVGSSSSSSSFIKFNII